MNVALVGFEIEGRAALTYWSKLGAHMTVCDQDPQKAVPDGIKRQLGPGYLKNLERFDLVWRTPAVNPETILRENPGIADKLTTTINEFLRVCPTKQVIGVTGTKGKGTTSTLVVKLLEAAGKTVSLSGNIGTSPLEFLPSIKPDSWVVLELSSFQLADLRYSPCIAVCLMVVPEHLNWHRDMNDYIAAKSQLFTHQQTSDLAIYYAANETSKQIASASPGRQLPYYSPPGAFVKDGMVTIANTAIVRTDELRLLGEHNWQNICAAVTTVWQISQNVEAIRSVLTTFQGLEHRLELVRESKGIKYYNDSFAATPDAAMAALAAIRQPKVAILGGFDRQLPLDHLAKTVLDHQADIRTVLLIGASGPRLAEELNQAGFHHYVLEPIHDMPTIVQHAAQAAQPGDAVLLSPGFASFDMFKNFVERGVQFKAAVWQL